jgi:glutathione S-transferase
MILVHGFAPLPPLPSPSPFCIKLETWLRMASFAYEVRADYSPLTAPRGQAPYATLDDGSVVADSAHIIGILAQRPAVTLDRWLGPRERALTTLVQRTVEDHLYYALLYSRWIDPDGYRVLRRTYFQGSFAPTRWLGAWLGRRRVRRTLWLKGTSRHKPTEIWSAAAHDLDALVDVLGNKQYFCGDRPSTVDAIAYGTLASLHLAPFPGPLQDAVRARPTLVRFVERVQLRYWP